MKRADVTAVDVAKLAGCSRTTVSFVLNDTPGKKISEETRQAVLRAAATLGYTPNEAARSLANARHYSVGLFICHSQSIYSDIFLVRLIEGLSQVFYRHRYKLVVHPIQVADSNYLEIIKRENLVGALLTNIHEHDRGLQELIASNIPVVVIGTLQSGNTERTVQVDVNNEHGARQMTEYLIGLGHRRIAMIAQAPMVYTAATERLRGYQLAMEGAGIEAPAELMRVGDFTEMSGYSAMKDLLSLDRPPSAVFAGNDVIAYGAIRAIKEQGLGIPEHISVAGFDDDYLSRFLEPPLTTINVPAAGLGGTAAKSIIEMIEDPDRSLSERRITLPTKIFERGSCRNL